MKTKKFIEIKIKNIYIYLQELKIYVNINFISYFSIYKN